MNKLLIAIFVSLLSVSAFAAPNETACKNFAEGQKNKYQAHRSQTEPRRQAMQKEYQSLMDEATAARAGRATESQKQSLKTRMSSFASQAETMKKESEDFRAKMHAENESFNATNGCVKGRR